jgi:hypothetical protein
MNSKLKPAPKPINLQVPYVQYDALLRKAEEQGITVQTLIRAGITGVTGVPDPTRPYTPPQRKASS